VRGGCDPFRARRRKARDAPGNPRRLDGSIGIAAKDIAAEDLTKLLAEDPAAKPGIIAYEVKTWMIGVDKP
jgi:hypothetical protein